MPYAKHLLLVAVLIGVASSASSQPPGKVAEQGPPWAIGKGGVPAALAALEERMTALEGAAANEAMVRRRFAELDNHNFDVLDELFAPSYVFHLPPLAPKDLNAVKVFYRELYTAFPDLAHTIEEQISARDKVTTRWIARGTHLGTWMGINPTGRSVAFTGINIYTVAARRFVESRVNWDLLGLQQQLQRVD
jgi:predicted ester cyclase